jgi:hypothetical protein
MFAPPVVYPAPAFAFDGYPVFVGPPAYGPPPTVVGPAYGAVIERGAFPAAPVPIAANYIPTQQPLPQEVARPSGPANFRITVSEAFLNRLIAQDRIEPGPVRDFILGAEVTGRQTTVARLRADLVPSPNQARVALLLNGDVQSETTGVTPQAMIDTLGRQQFVGVKEVYYDGVQLTTRHATVSIRAQNKTVGATTPLSGTLFGGLANRIAYSAAERQKAAGEAVARDRLAERLFPTFDGEIDERLAQANKQLAPLRSGLDSMKLLPASQSVWTTDTQLIHEAFIGEGQATASIPAVTESSDGENGFRIAIHESLMNTFFDRIGLKGLKTTDKKLREIQQSFLSIAGGSRSTENDSDDTSPLAVPGAGTFVTDIEFDEKEPLTVRVQRDLMIVTIKAHFKPAGQTVMPPMIVTIPYQSKIVGDKLRLAAGTPRVVSQERPDPDAPQTIIETAVQKVIEADLIPLEFERALPAAFWKAGGQPPRIVSLKTDDNGWLTIAVE